MCYTIPGEVIEVGDNFVKVNYFGEKRKARKDLLEDISVGDYVYAQGGFVIEKISKKEAEKILATWQEIFFKLQKRDLKIISSPPAEQRENLYQKANTIRQKQLGNSCCIHGIIEFSNYCQNSCFYCGLRKENNFLERYRMSAKEIVEIATWAVKKLGFKALVLQSGEDPWYTSERLKKIIEKIREECAVLLVLSIGERSFQLYKELYQAGARGILLRFETSNSKLYQKMKPNSVLSQRIKLLKDLQQLGYLVMSGFLIGIEKSKQEILENIKLTKSLGVEMFSFGPFIPHSKTPFKEIPPPSLSLVLDTIAQARLLAPKAKILVTTALETLFQEDGARKALLAGANSMMINLTPLHYRPLYELYPHRADLTLKVEDKIEKVIKLLHSLGRAPTDLGLN